MSANRDVDPPERTVQRDTWLEAVQASDDVVKDTLLVALLLGATARTDGTRALLTVHDVAKRSGLSGSTVRRRLTDLRTAGWIVVTERGHRRGDGSTTATVHALCLPQVPTDGDPQPLTQVDGGASTAQHPDSSAHSGERLSGSLPLTEPASTAHPGERPLVVPSEQPLRGAAQPLTPAGDATAAQLVDQRLGCGLHEASQVVARLCRGKTLRSPSAYVAAVGTSTLEKHLRSIRTDQQRDRGLADKVTAAQNRLERYPADVQQRARDRATRALGPHPHELELLREAIDQAEDLARPHQATA